MGAYMILPSRDLHGLGSERSVGLVLYLIHDRSLGFSGREG